MHPEISRLLEQAEERYLQANEVEMFQRYSVSLAKRLETYEILRDKEEKIFQSVADQLIVAFSNENQATLERCLKHWLLIVRYCATAMLLNDPEFLHFRLDEWIKGFVETYQTQKIEQHLYERLMTSIKENVSEKQMNLIQPFLSKAQSIILETND